MATQLVNAGVRVNSGSDWLYTLHKVVSHHIGELEYYRHHAGQDNNSHFENSDEDPWPVWLSG